MSPNAPVHYKRAQKLCEIVVAKANGRHLTDRAAGWRSLALGEIDSSLSTSSSADWKCNWVDVHLHNRAIN